MYPCCRAVSTCCSSPAAVFCLYRRLRLLGSSEALPQLLRPRPRSWRGCGCGPGVGMNPSTRAVRRLRRGWPVVVHREAKAVQRLRVCLLCSPVTVLPVFGCLSPCTMSSVLKFAELVHASRTLVLGSCALFKTAQRCKLSALAL